MRRSPICPVRANSDRYDVFDRQDATSVLQIALASGAGTPGPRGGDKGRAAGARRGEESDGSQRGRGNAGGGARSRLAGQIAGAVALLLEG